MVTTPSGETDRVALSGFVDRIERDDDGRLVAIDLKNMRSAVSGKQIPEHGQLGVYQLLLERGAASDLSLSESLPDTPRPVGGAALVQLRLDAGRGSTEAKVQFQEPVRPDEPTWVEQRLGAAAEVLRSHTVVATVGSACQYCSYATTCPAQPEGEQVIP